MSLKNESGPDATDGKALQSNLHSHLLSEIIAPECISRCRVQRAATEFVC